MLCIIYGGTRIRTAHRPEAKDACVNIAPINPLSHHSSVLIFVYSNTFFQAGIIEEMMEDAMESLEDQVLELPCKTGRS
jgi:hypothetical protein